MKQLFIAIFVSLIVLTSAALVLAQKPENEVGPPGIPERAGDYAVPGHPNLRVRVFVHPVKPTPDVEPQTLVCTQDPDSSAFVSWAGWKIPSGNWTYNLNPSSVPGSVGPSNLSTIASNGFSAWQNNLTTPNKPNLVRGADTAVKKALFDGIHTIAWNRIQASALGITYVWYYRDSRLLAEVDTIMNKLYSWKWSGGDACADAKTYDAQAILTHEQGHWFGLDDEYEDSYINNTMYGYGDKGDTKPNTPATGDIDGLKAIYP